MANSSAQTPPPPYNEHQAPNRPRQNQQTIPKSPHPDMHSSDQPAANYKRQFHTGSAHPVAPAPRRKSPDSVRQHSQFISSLSRPKRCFNFITIEPLAFFAILALYIEFPSIQDLIYTKICLQVIAQHQNVTPTSLNSTSLVHHSTLSSLPKEAFIDLDMNSASNSSTNQTSETRLSGDGRVQQPLGQPLTSNIRIPYTSYENQVSRDHFLCDRLNKTAIPRHLSQLIAEGNSLFWLRYQITICLLCAISSPYWGGMSDRIGRLIPLNVPIVMAAISNSISLVFGLLISMNSHLLFQVEWLYLGAILIGISGGQAVVIVSSFSFISDNTSSESRSKRVAVLESVIYLSHSVGFYITKHIMSLGLASPEQPWLNRHFVAFALCVSLNVICVLYSILGLRHQKFHRFLNNFEREQQEAFAGDVVSPVAGGSLGRLDGRSVGGSNTSVAGPDRARELTSSTPDDLDGPIVRSDKSWTDWGVILTLKYYKQTYETATKFRESRASILLLLLCGFVSALSLTSLMSLLFIYLHMEPFYWTTSQYSSWNSITSITRGISLVGLTLCMKFMKSWSVPDPLVAAVGFASKGIGLSMIATAKSSALINWALLAFAFSEFSMPPIRSLLSKLVIKEEVGKIYSCLAAIQSVCFLFGNVIFYFAYTSLKLQDFFRLSFLVVAGLQFSAVIIMLLIYTDLRRKVVLV